MSAVEGPGPSGTAADLSDRRLIARVARSYYLEDVSKVELARQFGISRFKIARMLTKARETGIVRIEILEPTTDLPMFSTPLARALGLRTVRVIDSLGEVGDVREQLGAMGAQLLRELVRPGDTVGIGWGRTMVSVASQLQDVPPLTAVQICGRVPPAESSPLERMRAKVEEAGGQVHAMDAPLYVPTAGERQSWRDQFAYLRAQYEHLDAAFVSVGSWEPPDTQIRAHVPPAVRERLDQVGAVAEIAGNWFDAAGRVVAPEVTRQCVTLETFHLKATPQVIAVAGGTTKAAAIAAVARSGFIDGLVTDRATAEKILQEVDGAGGPCDR